jgi:hypothetical protein
MQHETAQILLQDLTRPDGTIAIDRLISILHLTSAELATILNNSHGGLMKSTRLSTAAPQRKLRDFVEVPTCVAPWAGSVPQAFAWFCAQPLPSFGEHTPADLFHEGRAHALKDYISRIAVGDHA